MASSFYPFDYSSYEGVDTRVTKANIVTTQNFSQKQSELLAALRLDAQIKLGSDSTPTSTLIGSGVWNHYGTLGNDVLVGTAITDYLFGFSGRDNISGGKGNDFIYPGDGGGFGDGGEGIDTIIFERAQSNYTVFPQFTTQTGIVVNLSIITNLPLPLEVNTFSSIERLQFSDKSLALDVGPTQNAGSLYMLYKAAFNRAPDEGGMGYWLAQVDGGKNIVTDIAAGFVKAPEFVAKYGTNPTNAFYVDQLYLNVLGRPGEAGGVAYWNQELNTGARSKAEVLVQFATLPEGASLVADLIANGIPYQEWVG